MPSSSQQPSLRGYGPESQRRVHAAQETSQEINEIIVEDSDSENNVVQQQARASGSGARSGRRAIPQHVDDEDSNDDLDLDLPPPLAQPINGQAATQRTNGIDDRNGVDEMGPTPTMRAGEEREEDCIKVSI